MASAPASILVVDDDPMLRQILCRQLQSLGHQPYEAEDGRMALDKITEMDFNLVLLDLVMPEMDGFEVLTRLQGNPKWGQIPVIVISGSEDEKGAARSIELGAEDHIVKPFNPTFLQARVTTTLEKQRLRKKELEYLHQIQQEKEYSEQLLQVILPAPIISELKEKGSVTPQRRDDVAVLFCDVVGFTSYCDHHPPEDVIARLQRLVEDFEKVCLQHGMEKIKTIGDAFMCTAGLLEPVANPVFTCVECGLDMLKLTGSSDDWDVRIGIHVGPVIAGVIGKLKYLYDIWGDTVNTASRVESLGLPNSVNLSATAWEQVSGVCRGRSEGIVLAKGKGELEIFEVEGLIEPRPTTVASADIGTTPFPQPSQAIQIDGTPPQQAVAGESDQPPQPAS